MAPAVENETPRAAALRRNCRLDKCPFVRPSTRLDKSELIVPPSWTYEYERTPEVVTCREDPLA
jgi:hypothetical protein